LPEAIEEPETSNEQPTITEQDLTEPVLMAAPPLSGQAVYTYDPSGRLSTIALPDRTTLHFQYDDNNNLISINP
jgi:YD repeat-containing protein